MAKETSKASGAGTRERLLEVRSQLRKRTPRFIRADAHKRKRLKKVWRYPGGRHLKMGEQKRGARKRVEPGFRTPALVRGLSRSGHEPVMVHRLEDIEGMDSRTQAALLSATLGLRKKVEVVKAALKSKIVVLNMRNPEEFLEGVRERFAKKKEAEKEKETEEEKARTESIEAVVEKEEKPASTEEKPVQKEKQKMAQKKRPKVKPAKDVSAEEKAKQEQKERDRLLTRKN